MILLRCPTIFVSATSRGLKQLRIMTTDHLKTRGLEVVVQEEFDCDHQKIKDMIRDKISPCDAVLILVGPAYGFEATDWPTDVPKCSYTQLEYEIAIELKKPVYRYLASERYPLPPYDPELDERQQRQQAYIENLKAQDHVWYEFDSQEQLLTLLEKTLFHPIVKPNLPFDGIGTLFKGRDEAMALVRRSLLTRQAHATAVTSKQAIHGLGGVGKTRFAIEYAHRYASEYSARLYANADTPSALEANMAALCYVLDLDEQNEKEQKKQSDAVEGWFRKHAGWLLILDNVDTLEAQEAVNRALHFLTSGHVLITSRLTDWGGGVKTVELDTLAIPASTEFLLERTAGQLNAPTSPRRQLTDADLNDAEGLAIDLGGLALALEQAGAYICANRITFATYRSRLAEIERDVLKWFDAKAMKYPMSVALTWQASVNQLYPDGRNLLNLLAWLAPDPIPVAMIRTRPDLPPNIPILNCERAIQDLAAYSLARWNADGSTITVHRLVQETTRSRFEDPFHKAFIEDLVIKLCYFIGGNDPQDVRLWKPIFTPARPHIDAIVQHGELLEIQEPTNRLMSYLALYNATRGEHDAALDLYWRVLARKEASDGPNHPEIGTVLNNIAWSLFSMNRLSESEPLYRRAIAIAEASHGINHPDVARNLNNLAILLQTTNRLTEAEPLRRRALDIFEQALGKDHPNFAVALNNLGELLHSTNRLGEAESLFRRALAIDEANFGPDHPSVARELNNLGSLMEATNRLEQAEILYRRALAIHETSYGPEHPDLGPSMNNLAGLLWATNHYPEAESLYRRVIGLFERSLGGDHPNVSIALNNLGSLYRETNRLVEAEDHFRRSLAIIAKSYGPDQPDFAIPLKNLALVLQMTNRLVDAEPLFRRALAIDEASYGPDHPIVATDLDNLAELLHLTNRLLEAGPLFRRALAIEEASYGPVHPNVARTLNNLAEWFRATNNLVEAEPLMWRMLTIFEQSLGPSHPKVAIALSNLAGLLSSTNRRDKAELFYRRALAIDEACYGHNHPDVAIRLYALAILCFETNRPTESERLFIQAIRILFAFQQETGFEHPHFNTFIKNYLFFLAKNQGLTQERGILRIREILNL